jgi:hypothetical protein
MGETSDQAINWFKSTDVSVERYFIFSSLALIVVFAWMEPSGAAGIGFLKGLVFWTIQISILIPLLILTQHVVSHSKRLGLTKRRNESNLPLLTLETPWTQTALSGVLASIVFVPIGYFLDTLFAIPNNESSGGIIFGLIDEAAGVIVPVTVTWLALNAPWILQLDFSRTRPDVPTQIPVADLESSPTEVNTQTRFIQELRSRTSGELISISSELHYLRVVTSSEEVMFLYNLRDAIDELPASWGVQIHRSHWVSKEHVRELKRSSGNWQCVLSNGQKLPVSRRKYLEVKEILTKRNLS